jgi:hypothetical protein
MEAFNEELKRTAFQRKAVSRLRPEAVLEQAKAFFESRGYRTGRTGRSDQLYVMGGREGILPRVTGDVSARADVGKPGTTLVTLNAAGEKLGPAMADFLKELRAFRAAATTVADVREDGSV